VKSLIFLIVILSFMFLIFVVAQIELIENPTLFWLSILVLIFASFLTSATEAAFSKVSDDKNLAKMAEAKAAETVEKVEALDKKGTMNLTDSERGKREQLQNRAKRYIKKQEVMNGVGATEIVGSLSALSLLLNVGIVSLTAESLSSSPSKNLICFPVEYLTGRPKCQNEMFSELYGFLAPYTAQNFYEFTSKFAITFVASSIPILILGKILPKMIGFKYQEIFAYKMYWFGQFAFTLFGWISIAIKYSLLKFTKIKV
jgi:hypothetical protein